MSQWVHELFGRALYYGLIVICIFTSFLSAYEFLSHYSSSQSGVSSYRPQTRVIGNNTFYEKISQSFKLSYLKLENLSRPTYARQTFLLMIFIASFIRGLFMLLQLMLPMGLFYLNYFIVLPSIFSFCLYTVLSCYFTQLYYLFYSTTPIGSHTTAFTHSQKISSIILKLSSYFQYLLIFFIPCLLLLFIITYAATASTKVLNITSSDGDSVTTTTTTASEYIKLFQQTFFTFKTLLLMLLLYSGISILWKLLSYRTNDLFQLFSLSSSDDIMSDGLNSATRRGIRNPPPTNNPTIEIHVIKRMLLILFSSSFGIISSIVYNVRYFDGRFENWLFSSDAIMYALCEVFPTLSVLLCISKLKLFYYEVPDPPAPHPHADSSVGVTGTSINNYRGRNGTVNNSILSTDPVASESNALESTAFSIKTSTSRGNGILHNESKSSLYTNYGSNSSSNFKKSSHNNHSTGLQAMLTKSTSNRAVEIGFSSSASTYQPVSSNGNV